MNEWTREEANEKLRVLARRAQTDMEFRKLCLTEPAKAIAAIDPRPAPAWFRIRFVENQGATLTVVLPDPAQDSELSDSDLEQVAGGAGRGGCGTSCVVSCEFTAIH
jgi:hypothetical protein